MSVIILPPFRGVREGEVPAQRAEGSWVSLLPLMTPPSPYGDTSPRKTRGGNP
jgi:hypothetical protein